MLDRSKLDFGKIRELKSVSKTLDEKYGRKGTQSRENFDARARAWYYAEILKDARKSAGITQQELADRVGKKRTYISLVERGGVDMQLSTFIQMSEAVGLHLSLTYA